MKRLTKIFASAISVALAFILVAANLSGNAQAAVGDLDTTFGAGGKVITHVLADYNTASAVAIQADGKILVTGGASDGAGLKDFGLVRYQTNGSLDTNFGAGGKVTTDFYNSYDNASNIVVQANGYIVVAGTTTNSQGLSDFALARYTPNGNLDPNFGVGGKVTTDLTANSNDFAYGVALQGDGKIVVAGLSSATPLAQSDAALVRYQANGNLDTNFGIGGKVISEFIAGANDAANAVAIQTDNKIVIAGSVTSSGATDFALARYNTNGSLDGGFGNTGKVLTDFTGNSDVASAIAIQGDGRILAGGTIFGGVQSSDFVLARYNTNGALDGGFGVGGKTITDFYGNADILGGIAIQANGSIVAAGTALINGLTANFALVRYTTSGDLDAGFGSGGKIITDFFNSYDGASDVAIQTDGQIVAVGGASGGSVIGQADFALARYDGGGAVIVFDSFVQDENNDNLFAFNATTGEYQFIQCSTDFMLGGQGSITIKGCTVMLQHNIADRRILVKYDPCTKKATANVQVLSTGMSFSIIDTNTTNNIFSCPLN